MISAPPRARFMVELCALRAAVYSVAVRADPDPAIQQMHRFLNFVEEPALQEFVSPSKRAVDVWETAVKLLGRNRA